MPYLTTRENLKLQLSPGLVASYDIQTGNGVGLFWDTHPGPTWGPLKREGEEGMRHILKERGLYLNWTDDCFRNIFSNAVISSALETRNKVK